MAKQFLLLQLFLVLLLLALLLDSNAASEEDRHYVFDFLFGGIELSAGETSGDTLT